MRGRRDAVGLVLHPDGQLVFHDVFAGPTDELIFPVPWAVDPSISHLIGLNELDTLLRNAGFARVRWEDKTDASVNFFRTALERQRTNGSAPLGLHLLMGDDAAPTDEIEFITDVVMARARLRRLPTS